MEQAARDPLSVLNAVPVPTENLWPVWDSFFAGTHWSAGDVQRMLQAESVSRPGDGAVAQSGWMTFDGKNWRMDHGKAHPLNFLAGYQGRFLQCDAYQSYNALTDIALIERERARAQRREQG